MRLVDLNYNFECDCLIELSCNKLSDNKLSDNNLASELEENMSFLKPITIEEIAIFYDWGRKTAVQRKFPRALSDAQEHCNSLLLLSMAASMQGYRPWNCVKIFIAIVVLARQSLAYE